jgi:hypothetical protein
MFTHTAGQKVGKGTYWDMMTGHRVDFEQEGILPGRKEALYLKTSSSAILFLGPILGLAYIMLMPVMSVMTILALAVKKIFGKPFMLIKNMVSFGWRPNEAYLRGKSKKKTNTDKAGRSLNKK